MQAPLLVSSFSGVWALRPTRRQYAGLQELVSGQGLRIQSDGTWKTNMSEVSK